MLSKWRCRNCCGLLAEFGNEEVRTKNKTEEIVVTGKDFVVTKTCRHCQQRNVMRRIASPKAAA